MTIEDILAQLQDYGMELPGGGTYGDISGINQESIMQAMHNIWFPDTEYEDTLLRPEMFSTISPQMVESTYGKTYSPMVQSKVQGTLLSDLMATTRGQKATKAAGGFSGSGQFGQYERGARDVYGRGAGDVLATRQQGISSGVGGIQDLMADWGQQASELSSGAV